MGDEMTIPHGESENKTRLRDANVAPHFIFNAHFYQSRTDVIISHLRDIFPIDFTRSTTNECKYIKRCLRKNKMFGGHIARHPGVPGKKGNRRSAAVKIYLTWREHE
jgi:hypothetical protein